MSLALQEAETALGLGDFAVGAALTVEGELWGTARNSLFSDNRTTAHAEHNLICRYSSRLRTLKKNQGSSTITLYTTLEPCLMCLGITVLHRVNRVVVACPDPSGGTMHLDYKQLGKLYKKWWPTFDMGLGKERSCELILAFLEQEKFDSWYEMHQLFMALRESW